MTAPLALTINIDGGARGNPGPAAFGYVIRAADRPPLRGNGTLGRATNNVAEYTGLIQALTKALELGAAEVRVLSDSELLVRQMNGEYRVRNEGLQPLYQQARELVKKIGQVSFEHVYREANAEADQLCNDALDGKLVETLDWTPSTAMAPTSKSVKQLAEQTTVNLRGAHPEGPWLEGRLILQGRLSYSSSAGFSIQALGYEFPLDFGDLRRFSQTQPTPETAARTGSLVRIEGDLQTYGSLEQPEGARLVVRYFGPAKGS